MSADNSPILGPQPSSGILAHLPPVTYGQVAKDLSSTEVWAYKPVKKAKAAAAPAKAAPKKAAVVVKKTIVKKEKKVKKDEDEEEDSDKEVKEHTPRAPRVSGYGTVKEVVSGDSIVVVGAAVAGTSLLPERNISISGIVAPKLGRGRSAAEDQEFAWAARELLRQRILGQKVYFVINHTVGNRDFGTVFQLTASGDKEDVAVILVKAGLAEVKPPAAGKELPLERQALKGFETEAKNARLGKWTTDTRVKTSAVRLINWEPDARPLFEKHRGFPLPAIIDQVRDGSTLRCELLGERGVLSHVMITLYLAGVRAPNVPLSADFIKKQNDKKKKADDEDDEETTTSRPFTGGRAEPLAKEAQQFTELRLLNREVDVILQGVDTFGNFFGTVRFHRGNISLKLLEKGLARVVPWSAALTSEGAAYAQAEAEAKAARVGLWENYDASDDREEKFGVPSKSTVRVVGVSSGDTIVVADEKGNETKHPLASIRCPRMGNARREEPAQAWGWEAREYVRRTLIGKTVQIVEEYTRELRPNQGTETKRGAKKSAPVEIQRYVTVIYNKENISEQLVLRGLATVIHHRPEEPRSLDYALLLSAEAKAVEAKKGQHGKGAFQRVTDLSGSGDDRKQVNASAYLNELKGQPFEAVVEYVFSASRLKLYVPHKGILITFVLGGIQTKPTKDKSFPIGDQASARTKELVFQQTVRVSVDGLDKGDSFIGAIDVGSVSLGATLLQEGLATVYRNMPADQQRPVYTASYDKAEALAQENKVGWWVDHIPGSTEGLASAEGEGKHYNVRVTEIKDAATFYVHVVGDTNVEEVESRVKAFNEDVKDAPEDFKVAAGDIVAAKWGIDADEQSYYRVRIEGETRAGGKYRVFFIDYGNSDVVTPDVLRPLPEDLAKLPAIARSCQLAGVMAPFQSSPYSDDASHAFNDIAMGKELLAHVELIRDEQWLVTLNQESTPVSINAQLVQQGWVKLQKRPPRRLTEYVRAMIGYKTEAQTRRHGIFEDPANLTDEEEEADDLPRGARGGATSGGRRRGVGGGKGSDRPQNVIAPPVNRDAATAKAPAKAAAKAKAAAPAKAAVAAPAKAAAAVPAAKKAGGKGK